MKTTFEYIDEAVEKITKVQPVLNDSEKAEAAKHGRKIIGGFRVRDPEEERKALDALVAKKIKGTKMFLEHREIAKKELKKANLTPLAVVPTSIWDKICYDTGLYIFSPNSDGRVAYDRHSLDTLVNDKNVDAKAKKDWKWFLDLAFPLRKSLQYDRYYWATLILPDPPEDVAATLRKAAGLNLQLKVAAVAEAISFVEKPSEIVRQSSKNGKDLWAQAQGYADYADWVKRDPIVFAEFGGATAIIAQFGDFPVEKEVVDKALSVSSLTPEGVSPEVAVVLNPGLLTYEQYQRALAEQTSQQRMQQAQRIQQAQQAQQARQARLLYQEF